MHTGGCLCGLVKYEIEGELNVVVNCHCQYCRLAHGAEFVSVAMLSAEKLKLLEGEEFLSRYEVREVAAFRCFCSKCGTRLFNHSPSFNFISLVTATLADSIIFKPVANVNMESRNLGFEQSNGLPSFDKFPSTEELGRLK